MMFDSGLGNSYSKGKVHVSRSDVFPVYVQPSLGNMGMSLKEKVIFLGYRANPLKKN